MSNTTSSPFQTPSATAAGGKVRYELATPPEPTQRQLGVGCEAVRGVVQSNGRRQYLIYSDDGIVKAKPFVVERTITERDER